MISIIYIPVLFVCMNGDCQFMQGVYYTRELECKGALVAQIKNLQEMARKGGQELFTKGVCITAKEGLL